MYTIDVYYINRSTKREGKHPKTKLQMEIPPDKTEKIPFSLSLSLSTTTTKNNEMLKL